MSVAGSLGITYVRSGIGHPRDQKETVCALGLRRLHQSVVRPDTPPAAHGKSGPVSSRHSYVEIGKWKGDRLGA